MPALLEKHKWLIFLLLLGIGFLIYSNTLHSSFHFDDASSIIYHNQVRDLSSFSNLSFWLNVNNRPLSVLTLALNYHFSEYQVESYHVINILIHIISSFLVYLITSLLIKNFFFNRNTLNENWALIPLFAALIFLVHPIQTQSVTYIVQRMTALSALFYLLSLFLYLKGRLLYVQRKGIMPYLFYLAACIAGVLAVLSKQHAITFPVAFLLAELYFVRTHDKKPFRKYLLTTTGILFVISLLYLAMGQLPKEMDSLSRIDYFLTQSRVLIKYIQLLFVPVNLNLDYDFLISSSIWDIKVLSSFLGIFVLCIITFYSYSRSKLISFGIIWLFLTLSIESSFLPIRDVINEHRLYLPMFGYSLIIAYGLGFLFRKKKMYYQIVIVLVVIIYGSATFARNNIWKTEYSLWRDAVSKSPGKARPWANLGYSVMLLDSTDRAIVYFEKALSINPEFSNALNNLGLIWQRKNRPQKAMEYFRQAVKLSPSYVNALNNAGCALVDLGNPSEALVYFQAALDIDPAYERLYYNLAIANLQIGEKMKAIFYLKKSLELDPLDTEALNNLGKALFDINKYEEAIHYYHRALDVEGDLVIVLNNLGNAYYKAGHPDKAIECYKRALNFDPSYQPATNNLNIVLELLKQGRN